MPQLTSRSPSFESRKPADKQEGKKNNQYIELGKWAPEGRLDSSGERKDERAPSGISSESAS